MEAATYLQTLALISKSSVEGKSKIYADWKQKSVLKIMVLKVMTQWKHKAEPTDDHDGEDSKHSEERNHLSEILWKKEALFRYKYLFLASTIKYNMVKGEVKVWDI